MTTTAPRTTGPGLKVATIAGVPVHLAWSWFALAAAISLWFGLGAAGGSAAGFLVGLGYALFLLAAVLVHEGAHAGVARALGIPVHRVVADFLGGHTAFDARGLTAGRSALIALAGPVGNLTFAALVWLGGQGVGAGVLHLVLAGAAWINLLLAAFNLLPGLPLDGGQLVEAMVWGATGRRSRGMVAAGWGGRVLAVALGLWFLGRPLIEGTPPDTVVWLWALLLGSTIWRGGSAAIARGAALAGVDGITLGTVAAPAVLLPVDTPLSQALATGRVAVGLDETGRPTLVLVAWEGHDPRALPQHTPMAAVMRRIPDGNAVEAGPSDPVTIALAAMATSRVGLAVLCADGVPWGVVSADAVQGSARAAH